MKYEYYIPGKEGPVEPGSSLWETPLSGEKNAQSSKDYLKDSSQKSITIGQYFNSASTFLSREDYCFLKIGVADCLKTKIEKAQIRGISISLEKHGAFYHPIKVSVHLMNLPTAHFVLNGAVSQQGLLLVENEYQLLRNLSIEYGVSKIPKVFGSGVQKVDGHIGGFFIGQWFEGFQEFHVTNTPKGKKIILWGSDKKDTILSFPKAARIYEKISTILTQFYNIETFEQIFPWHHAAGDFIVQPVGDDFDVKLITVRGYANLSEFDETGQTNQAFILPALLFFFLNLSLRMQIDRIDGTGEVEFLGDEVLKATIKGFLEALDDKTTQYDLGDLRSGFTSFFKQFDIDQIVAICERIIESYNQNASELSVIKRKIFHHCKSVCENLPRS